MLSLFHKKKPKIGLELHPSEIRLVQLKPLNQTTLLEKFAIAPLSSNDHEEVQKQIEHVARQTETQGQPVSIAFPADKVVMKQIKLPNHLTPEECEQKMAVTEDMYFDFVSVNHESADFQEILLVTAQKEAVDHYVRIVEKAGFDVQSVDVDSFALARAVVRGNDMQAILNFHSTHAQFMLFQQQKMIFSQQWSIQSLEELIQKIKRAPIENATLIIAGYAENLSEMMSTIEVELQRNIVLANPFINMQIATEIDKKSLFDVAPRMLVSCGLALQSALSC